MAALVSWGIALSAELLQVPADRIGATRLDLGELEIIPEVVAPSVFVPCAVLSLKQPRQLNSRSAAPCICAAAWFVFREP